MARPFIRDTIVIGADVQRYYDTLVGDGPAILLARDIRHAPGAVLRLSGRPLLIVCDRYDSGDGMIDGRGVDSTAPGGPGTNGRPARLVNELPEGPGEDGGAGGAGGDGGPGTPVTLLCRTSGTVHVRTTGGNGAHGGNGGNGGRGVDGFFVFSGDPDNPGDEIVPGTRGGFGGPGGAGGHGGVGGELVVMSERGTDPSLMVAGGGRGGPGGVGGVAGVDGQRTNEFACPEEGPGCRGPSGEPGAFPEGGFVTLTVLDGLDFILTVLERLGPLTSEWAEHRARVGEFFFRQHNAAISDRAHLATMAADEFRAAIFLENGNARAIEQQALLRAGQNPLGFPRDLDLIPRFDAYIDAFARFGALSFEFLTLGSSALLSATELAVLRSVVALRQSEASATMAEARDDIELAKRARDLTVDEAALVQRRLDAVKQEIEAAIPRMRLQTISIGDIVGPLALVAVAVVGVIASVATGGASLVALVPAFVALTNAIVDDGEPAVKALFAGDDDEFRSIEKKYKQVGSDIESVVAAGQSIVNFVRVVERISAGSRPQTAPQVALIKRGAELAHELLIAKDRIVLAENRIFAVEARLARATEFSSLAAQVAASIDENVASVRAAGLLAIEAARSKVDLLLGFAFQAQRSLEIYTLANHEADVLYDAGSLHPDVVRGYAEGFVSNGALLGELTTSWARLLEPGDMQSDFLSFFSDPTLDSDVLRLSFRDAAFLDTLGAGGATFRIEATDLPPGRFDTKVLGVAVALVGATSPDGVISTEIEHHGRYEQRRRGGSIATQFLKPRRSTRLAGTRQLELPGVDFSADPPLTAPVQLAFWGRGVGGEWTVHITEDQSGADEINLGGLLEMQVWIKYQFAR